MARNAFDQPALPFRHAGGQARSASTGGIGGCPHLMATVNAVITGYGRSSELDLGAADPSPANNA
jgi:hypothetical protein